MLNYTNYYVLDGIDGLTEGNKLLTTTEASGNFYPLQVYIIPTSNEMIEIDCIVSIGTNDGDYNNIVYDAALTDGHAVCLGVEIPPITDIYVRVSKVGKSREITFKVILIGYYN